MARYNTADPSVRETKLRQGGPNVSIAELFGLQNRTVIVTGAAGYLGRELVGTILKAGADVIGFDVLEIVPDDIWGPLEIVAVRCGRRVSYFSVDQTKPEQIGSAFAQFTPTLTYPIRGLVAAAAISGIDAACDLTSERLQQVLGVNVTGTFAVAKAVALEMKKADGSGSVVLVASMSGTVANRGVDTLAYNTSKSALLQLARSLAAEWGSRKGMPLIRVNTLSPGYIITKAMEGVRSVPGIENQWRSDNMLYRLSTVDEYRGPILFLLSDASSYMTASDLRVDGGHCAW